jgi:hypothetical protein
MDSDFMQREEDVKRYQLARVTLCCVLVAFVADSSAQPPALKKTNIPKNEINAALSTILETHHFDEPLRLKEVLDILHEQLLKKTKKKIGFVIDEAAFAEADAEAPDLLETVVRGLKRGQELPASTLLATILLQIPQRTPNYRCTYIVHDGYVRITTPKRVKDAKKPVP